VGIPFSGIGIDADFKAIEEAFRDPPPPGPSSFYHRAFKEMESAVKKFGQGGERRIVVFIDDLDRCLPASALSVLESMKLFFDFEGFVFVVGLDQDVVHRAIGAKYGIESGPVFLLPSSPGSGERAEASSATNGDYTRVIDGGASASGAMSEQEAKKIGAEYVKKIFQVPFSLPRISTQDVGGFFRGLLRTSGIPGEQRSDLDANVKPHLGSLSGEGALNPREVKRLINAYTLQMKLLSARQVRNLQPQVVVALLTMSFRTEWRHIYDLLVADPSGFADAVRPLRDAGTDEGSTLWPGDQTVPRDLLQYLGGPGAPILATDDLERYVASVEATRTSTVELGPAQGIVVDLGRRFARAAATGEIPDADRVAIQSGVERLREALAYLPSLPSASRLLEGHQLLVNELQTPAWDDRLADSIRSWSTRNERVLRGMYENLRQIRLATDIGGHA